MHRLGPRMPQLEPARTKAPSLGPVNSVELPAPILYEDKNKDGTEATGSRPVRFANCPGQGMSVEHHEEVSCTGRIALVCTRVLGPHNVLDTIGTFGCRTILIALGDVRTGEWTMVGPRNALLEGPDRDGCLELCTNANGLHEIAAWISAGK